MPQLIFLEAHASADGDALLNAACTLGPGDMRERLAEWRAVIARSQGVRMEESGAILTLAADEPINELADLVDRESGCCGFYRFTLRVDGGGRELAIDAGPRGFPAVAALLSLD